MQRNSTTRAVLRAAAVVIALAAAAGAQAQVSFSRPYLGGSVGDTDLGTGIRLFGGGSLTNIFGIEGQIASYGSNKYQNGAYTYKDSAWTAGAYGTASFPVATSLSVFGKLGAHYFKMKQTGPGRSYSDGSVELGIGAGVKWQFVPQAALRADFENIGGSGGDMISIGLQFSLE